MTGSPNNQVETNRCQASRLRSWPVIGDSFPVCHGTLTAAVAHLKRSEELRFPGVRGLFGVSAFALCLRASVVQRK